MTQPTIVAVLAFLFLFGIWYAQGPLYLLCVLLLYGLAAWLVGPFVQGSCPRRRATKPHRSPPPRR